MDGRELRSICYMLQASERAEVSGHSIRCMCHLGEGKSLKLPSLPWMRSIMRFMLHALRNGKLIRMPQNLLGCRSLFWLKRGRIKESLLQKVFLKYMKDFVLDKLISNVRYYKESKVEKGAYFDGLLFFLMPTLALVEPNIEAQILVTMSMETASIGVDKEEHYEDVLLDQVKKELKKDDILHNQNPVPKTKYVVYLSTTRKKDDDNDDDDDDDDDDDGAPLRFPLRNSSQANHDQSIKKSPKNKSKVRDKLAYKKGEVRNPTIKIKKT
ncbi:hypothetical protein Cgig2_007451 [Carnegiea gigantea]|uniref:Uncharacterized protein n=1 Tax=Carnegiea gigantea TaxID=171969 RepID=A0A9Q1JLZ4_9CARY|nr:hypothetical protein Cgig2_007451 [Carnegiea gigantea]